MQERQPTADLDDGVLRDMKPLAVAPQNMPRSGIRRILDMAASLPDVVHLEIGQPDFPTPAHIIEAAYRAAHDGYTTYTANAGLASLREAISTKLATDNAIRSCPQQVVVTTGGMGGLFSAFTALLNPGDEVLIPDPGYPNYMQLACLCHASATRYSLDAAEGFALDVNGLTDLVTPRTKAIVINSPSNPTGMVHDPKTVEEIVAFAQRHDLYVISDECYEKIVYDGSHLSPASLDSDGRVITIFSFSKTYAMTGWRVGYIVAHSDLAPILAKLQEPTVACAPSLSQKAAEAALLGPQTCVAEMVAAYRLRRDRAIAVLASNGLTAHTPGGAFYLLVPIGGCDSDSQRFAEDLLSHESVAVAPGSTFGPEAAGFVRISLANSMDQIEVGVERLCAFIIRRSGVVLNRR